MNLQCSGYEPDELPITPSRGIHRIQKNTAHNTPLKHRTQDPFVHNISFFCEKNASTLGIYQRLYTNVCTQHRRTMSSLCTQKNSASQKAVQTKKHCKHGIGMHMCNHGIGMHCTCVIQLLHHAQSRETTLVLNHDACVVDIHA